MLLRLLHWVGRVPSDLVLMLRLLIIIRETSIFFLDVGQLHFPLFQCLGWLNQWDARFVLVTTDGQLLRTMTRLLLLVPVNEALDRLIRGLVTATLRQHALHVRNLLR